MDRNSRTRILNKKDFETNTWCGLSSHRHSYVGNAHVSVVPFEMTVIEPGDGESQLLN
jgi:hypothetical protein